MSRPGHQAREMRTLAKTKRHASKDEFLVMMDKLSILAAASVTAAGATVSGADLIRLFAGDRASAVSMASGLDAARESAKALRELSEYLTIAAQRVDAALNIRPDRAEILAEARAAKQRAAG